MKYIELLAVVPYPSPNYILQKTDYSGVYDVKCSLPVRDVRDVTNFHAQIEYSLFIMILILRWVHPISNCRQRGKCDV